MFCREPYKAVCGTCIYSTLWFSSITQSLWSLREGKEWQPWAPPLVLCKELRSAEVTKHRLETTWPLLQCSSWWSVRASPMEVPWKMSQLHGLIDVFGEHTGSWEVALTQCPQGHVGLRASSKLLHAHSLVIPHPFSLLPPFFSLPRSVGCTTNSNSPFTSLQTLLQARDCWHQLKERGAVPRAAGTAQQLGCQEGAISLMTSLP